MTRDGRPYEGNIPRICFVRFEEMVLDPLLADLEYDEIQQYVEICQNTKPANRLGLYGYAIDKVAANKVRASSTSLSPAERIAAAIARQKAAEERMAKTEAAAQNRARAREERVEAAAARSQEKDNTLQGPTAKSMKATVLTNKLESPHPAVNGNEAAKTAHSLAHKAGKATARAEKTIIGEKCSYTKGDSGCSDTERSDRQRVDGTRDQGEGRTGERANKTHAGIN